MDIVKDLYELCDTLSKELTDVNEKIRNAGGKMSAGDLEVADKLTHAIKSVKATIAMVEDEDGYSGYYPHRSYSDGYRGNSYRMSYARRRDSRGRYSGERGYSRNDLADKMRDLMDDAPDERTRQEMERMVNKLENA